MAKATLIVVTVSIAIVAAVTLLTSGGRTSSRKPPTIGALKPDLRGAGPALERVYADAGRLLPGGYAGFRARLAELHGHPVVVNKWASWCGPCRAEFPFFQQAAKRFGGRVAFIGVNAHDTKPKAAEFLRNYPVPYPSYVDPRDEISAFLHAVQYFPATAYFAADGSRRYTKFGQYASLSALDRDVRRYALSDSRKES